MISEYFQYPAGGDADDESEVVFLGDRTEREWARLLGMCEMRRLRPGEVLIRAGDIDRSLYIARSGAFEFLAVAADGHERRLSVINAPSVFGEVAFFDGSPRSGTIRALGAAEVARLDFDAFEVLATQLPALGRAMLVDLGKILALRLRRATDRGVQNAKG